MIQKFISSTEDNDDRKVQSIATIKSNTSLKQLSKYIRGGISKMSKGELQDLTQKLHLYDKDVYVVGKKKISPDHEQIKIIEAPLGNNIRVIAGAGTGKTTTIACRIKYLLDTSVTPDKILVLTFNVEARKNLESMIDRLMGFEIKMEIRTIDSFCFKIKNDFGTNNLIKNNSGKTSIFGDANTNTNSTNSVFTPPPKNCSLSEFGTIGRKIMEKYGKEICSQYEYVFFDEFQDVNEDQFEILRQFVSNGCKLTVIGDDSQNIYQFRGSDNHYIINFDRIFPNTITYKITTNYRSTKEIIDLANQSIINNKERIHKMMKPATKEQGAIDLSINDTNNSCIEQIFDKIRYYTEDLNIPYDDIAILSRNTSALKSIETEFEKNKIPYVALISDQYSNDYKQVIQQNKIVLSTIHKAKGLEWKVVFIIGLCDSRFPNHLNNGLKNIEEERRLFYVGVTRAKRYLHFVAGIKEVPLSRFIGEVEEHVEIINNAGIREVGLFDGTNEDVKKDAYSVTKMIEMMSGKHIEKLREMFLIPDVEMDVTQLFIDPLRFTDEIKKNVYESDYGIYCDYYLTRQLMVMNEHNIKDVNVELALFGVRLTDDEKIIYSKYDIKNCLVKGKNKIPVSSDKKENDMIKKVVKKITDCMELTGLDIHAIDHLLLMGSKSYIYPESFINKLRESYEVYKDKSVDKDDVKDAIYYVSLCPKFSSKRHRLVYRDIRNLYDENSVDVFPRIDEYVEMLKDDDILCKLAMNKLYKINKDKVSLCGELDYLNVTNNTIVDIKCSEGDFKIEWLLQLLMYYALFMCNPGCCPNYDEIVIKNLAVFNVFTGCYYETPIPENYDWNELLEYVGLIISDDLKGIRPKANITIVSILDQDAVNVDSMTTLINIDDGDDGDNVDDNDDENNDDDDKEDEIEYYNIDIPKITTANRSGYIVFDVENNCVNQDIIQLAYIVCDDNHKNLKQVKRYIKDRFVDGRAIQITNITTDTLRKHGILFNTVMEEFLTDVAKVSFVCGHHVCTDISKVRSNLEKFKIRPSRDIFNDVALRIH